MLSFHVSYAAPVQVFGPKQYAAKTNTATYNSTFNHTQNNSQGVITVTNGDGTDLSPKTCSGNIIQRLLCAAENLIRTAAVALLRPTSIEISVNGIVKVATSQLQPSKGSYQTSLIVNRNNTLIVKVKGSPLANITVGIKAESANVNLPPVANFSFTPTSGIAPELVSFSGLTSSDPDGSIVSYEWNFGDGGTALGALPVHSYVSAGNYNVTLTVTDNQGARSSRSQVISILQNQLPQARFTFIQNPSNIYSFSFDATSSTDADGSIVEYNWDFGDSSVGTGSSISHTYNVAGTYSVRLTIKDNKGGTSSTDLQILIADQVPPQILSLSPGSGSTVGTGPLTITGVSNEALASAEVAYGGNTIFLTLSADKMSFNGSISLANLGSQSFSVKLSDLAGNITTSNISLFVNANHFWRYAECSTQESGL